MASIKKEQILESIEFCEKNGYFEKLNDIYSTLPKGDCAGCGNCCMESVGINLIEFLNIYRYLAEKQELRECSIERIVDYYFMELMKKNSCPFRDENNRCLIYEVRPLRPGSINNAFLFSNKYTPVLVPPFIKYVFPNTLCNFIKTTPLV